MPLKQRKQIFKINITVKNPNWLEEGQLVICKVWTRIWTQDYQETNPASDRVEALNPGPPDYSTDYSKLLGRVASYDLLSLIYS